MVYSRIIPVSSCIVKDASSSDPEEFEPASVIQFVPDELIKSEYTVVVTISDGDQSLEYNLDTFMSKTYSVRNGKIRFGAIGMSITSLVIMVGLKFYIEDLINITSIEMD